MKLRKVYADKKFKNIQFHDGLNVILGKMTDTTDDTKDTHNLGKSLLGEVIDFLMLKQIKNKDEYFLTKYSIFRDYTFYLELELNNGHYLTIRRSTENNTKISFRQSPSTLDNVFDVEINDWDYEDLPLIKSRERLNLYLNFDVGFQDNYRKGLNYFLRSQNDFLDVFKLNKYRGADSSWKPFVFSLLGFDYKLIDKRYEIQKRLEDINKSMGILKRENSIDITDRDKYVGLLEIHKGKIDRIKTTLNEFDFYEKEYLDKNILVEQLDTFINLLNANHYRLKSEIKTINESLSKAVDFINLKDLENLYKEVGVYFEGQIKKDYEELIDFNKKITLERKRFLEDNLKSNTSELLGVEKELRELQKSKSDILSNLIDRDSYSKFKEYQQDLSKLEGKQISLEAKLKAIDRIIGLEEELFRLNEGLVEIHGEIQKEISSEKHNQLRILFNDFVEKVLDTNAILSIEQNTQGNINFKATYQNKEDLESTDEGKGNSYKKLLCSTFDISLLTYYSSKSYYRFIYHDGVIDGLDTRKKIKFFDEIRRICAENNVQYIITVIQSELSDNELQVNLEEGDVALVLSDESCEGKLFEQCF